MSVVYRTARCKWAEFMASYVSVLCIFASLWPFVQRARGAPRASNRGCMQELFALRSHKNTSNMWLLKMENASDYDTHLS